MRMRALILLLLLPAIATADWIDRQGESSPDSDSRKTIGAFSAQLLLVGDEQQLFKYWDTPSEIVNVKTVDSVWVNETINAVVVFGGCKASWRRSCNVTMRFRVVQPDGKVYSDVPPIEVWKDKAPPPGKSQELGVQYLKVRIEPKDQPGTYVVHAQVRDNVTGSVLHLRSPFTANK
jgi:hypothetical protein